MAGQVHITTPQCGLPNKYNEVCIEGGRYGWLIAADTIYVPVTLAMSPSFRAMSGRSSRSFRSKVTSRLLIACCTRDLVWKRTMSGFDQSNHT